MIAMNKPAYSAIMTHSPTKPVIVFVSSRRQTRLTAQDFISLCANDDNPRRFLHMPEVQMDLILQNIKDPALKLSLQFGIGLHHAGIVESDRKTVEELFMNCKIQILVATSTLAWGVNMPAHLVVVKGTEFYDAKTKGYKDFPITDVLQMMGRAGRPQFDDSGVACVLVHDVKKNFYKKFLHEPFPVESSMHTCLEEHLNAEIAGGTIKSKQDAMDYITWTYLYRRIFMNPSYYGCEDYDEDSVNAFLSRLIEESLDRLFEAGCIDIPGEDREESVHPTPFGMIASHYYLKYTSMRTFQDRLARNYSPPQVNIKGSLMESSGDFPKLLRILCDADEFSELPVRHNEDLANQELDMELPIPVLESIGNSPFDAKSVHDFLSPHLKAFLLLEAHLTRFTKLPISDYVTDTISVLDQTIRVVQAMIDVSVFQGYYRLTRGLIDLLQCVKQAVWPTDSSLLCLPVITAKDVGSSKDLEQDDLNLLFKGKDHQQIEKFFAQSLKRCSRDQIRTIIQVVEVLPLIEIGVSLVENSGEKPKFKEGRWYVQPGKEYEIKVTAQCQRLSRRPVPFLKDAPTVYCPRFPKAQQEGWFLVFGSPQSDELHALKRISPNGGGSQAYLSSSIKFVFSEQEGDFQDFKISVQSDGYRGLDSVSNLAVVLIK